MIPREILELQKKRPFPGLRIQLSDGGSYDVTHPEMMVVARRLVFIALPPLEEDVPEGGWVHCDPMQITRIGPLNARKRSSPGKRRKS